MSEKPKCDNCPDEDCNCPGRDDHANCNCDECGCEHCNDAPKDEASEVE